MSHHRGHRIFLATSPSDVAPRFDGAETEVGEDGLWIYSDGIPVSDDPDRGLDMGALRSCTACVLVLPCGRSAHLELGIVHVDDDGVGEPVVPQVEP